MSIPPSGLLNLSLGSHGLAKPDSEADTRPKISLSRLHQQIRKLPTEVADLCIPKQKLVEDLLELGSPEKGTPKYHEQSSKIHLLTMKSLDKKGENNHWLRHSLRQGQPRLFNALLKSNAKPDLAPLFEIAAIKKDQPALDKVFYTAEKTHEVIPKKTFEFVAACGGTDQLKRMFPLSRELTEEDQTDLLKLAEQQQKEIEEHSLNKGVLLHKACNFPIGTPEEEVARTLKAMALIQAGANVHDADDIGDTPLQWASSNGHGEIAHALIQTGTDVNAANEIDGDTPLHLASSYLHKGIAQALIQAGANINVANIYGNTPLQWASSNGHGEIVQLLKAHGATE